MKSEESKKEMDLIELNSWEFKKELTGSHAYFLGRKLVIGSSLDNNIVLLENVNTAAVLKSLDSHSECVICISFSKNGAIIASASEDKTMKLWAAVSGKLITTHKVEDYVCQILFSRNGRLLINSCGSAIQIRDAKNMKLLRQFERIHLDTITSLSQSPDDAMLVSGSFDHFVKLWQVGRFWHGKCQNVANLEPGHTYAVFCVAFSSDGKMVVSGSFDKMIKLWDVVNKGLLRNLTAHSCPVYFVAFSLEDHVVVSGSGDSSIKFSSVSTGEILVNLETGSPVWSVSFSQDARTMASGHVNNEIKIWEC